ncbi:class I SAM-dependent methyltransferase [Flavobacterium orientale]|uniref:Methyltransferase domain-containing protein n=1 Tax=Flavobacterium orientale TaxID=1756020 RepID=A0A917D8L7_9FLAO|nr:class I SAM-dependent methyltransferase [Flavobacterium orientale]GGD15084.1 hypothetical protein GCM10011343_02590 [Flavobacterium orientale]
MSEFLKCKICESQIELLNEKFNLVQCTSCSLIFAKKIFTEAEFIATYDQLYNQTSQYGTHGNEFEKLKKNGTVFIGRPKLKVLRYILKSDNKHIVEIGAGVGIVANYLTKLGLNYTGIELDEPTAKKAQSLGYNVRVGDFSKVETIEGKLDAIVAFEVVEHLQDLPLFFELIQSKLKKGGYFGFTVPNYNKRLNYDNPGSKIYQSGPPIHLNYFTLESIEKIAKRFGFKIHFCETKKYPYFNWNKRDTYKFILKSLLGNFHGATIMCVLSKE